MSEEMQLIEWKSNWRDEWLQWICGYANAQGGILEVGKDDKGKIIGLKDKKKLLEDIPNKIKNSLGIIADVDLKNEGENFYIAISVQPYSLPISHHGKYHYRSGSTKQELSGRALDEFMLKKMGKTWDAAPVSFVKYQDLDSLAFESFREKASSSGRLSSTDLNISNLELLDNLRLIEGNHLKNAAILLFHKDPDLLIPGAYVKIGYFETDADLLYQDELHGSLVVIADKIMDILYSKYLKGIIHYEGTQRVDKYPVDKESMREAILNSLVHKDYTQGIPVQIKVFPDRVFIFNAGRLPESWTLETLFKTHGSKPRNPLLASVAFRAGLIESWGRGIEKMVDGCNRIGAPTPVINELGGDMSVEFVAPKDAVVNLKKELSEQDEAKEKPIKADKSRKGAEKEPKNREQVVLDFVEDHGSITNRQAQDLLGLADSTVKRLLTKMVSDKLLKAVGERKTRTYLLAGIIDKQKIENTNPQDFRANDFVALMLFKSEYDFIKAFLEMNEKGDECLGRLMESIIPYVALIAHESSKWLQEKSGENLLEENPQLNRKRMLFKYYDDTSYTAKEYDEHCADILNVSSRFFKKPAGLLSFIQQDAGVFFLDDLAIGSTYTSFRYLYEEFVGTDYLNDQDFVNAKAGEVGFIIGEHSAFLVALMEAFGLKSEPLKYEAPKSSDKDYDFFLGNLTAPLYKLNDDNSTPGLFIILSDAYFSLGLFRVLIKRKIIDSILGLKLVLLTLHHLKSSINTVVALSHKQLSHPFSSSLQEQLNQLFEKEEKQLLKKW